MDEKKPIIPKEWLIRPAVNAAAWQANWPALDLRLLIEDVFPGAGETIVPKCMEDWAAFRAHLLPADELWHYYSGRKTREQSRGYAIVRNGEVVEIFNTFMTW